LLGEADPATTRALFNLAAAMHAVGDYRGARPLIDQWTALIAKQPPEMSPARASELNHLSAVYQFSGQLARAESLSRMAVSIDSVVYGPRHSHTALTMVGLGTILDEEHKATDAQSVLGQAVEIVRAAYPSGHLDLAYALRSYAIALEHGRRFDDATVALREAMPMALRLGGAENVQYVDTEQELAFSLTMSGHGREAEPLARHVLRHFQTKYGDKNLLTVRARIYVAEALREQRRFSEAEPALLSVYETVKGGRGMAANVRWFAANALARLYDAKGQPDEAAKYRALAPAAPTAK
jgi:tetratricopeptide (TPR) repeat protein